MRIEEFEATGLERVESWLERCGATVSEPMLRQALKTCNASFLVVGIDRVQSTLLCELNDSYVQQSQRYVALNNAAYQLPELAPEDEKAARDLTEAAFSLYEKMSELKPDAGKGRPKPEHYRYGIPIEDARYILPLSARTNVCVALSGDKLIELFGLLKDARYAAMFIEMRHALRNCLPSKVAEAVDSLPVVQADHEALQALYADYYQQITPERDMLLLEQFADLDGRVACGALTSTAKETAVEAMGRWGDDAPEKARALLERVLSYGHDSIAEQARTTIGMMCSMVTYHQQLRHRLARNQREELAVLLQETARPVVVPQTVRCSPFAGDYLALTERFKTFRADIAGRYGAAQAYSFLLNCDRIKLVSSTNARADVTMLAERTCMNAQWEIRELAVKKLLLLRGLSDVLYEKALPSCVLGSCREGRLSCGRAAEVRERFAVR